MEGSEVLLTLAEIAIGLAGFSGVVVAFSQTRRFPPEDRVRFLMLIGGTFSVVVLAFVPFLMLYAGRVGPEIWRWSSAVFLLVWLVAAPLTRKGRSIILKYGTPAPGWSVASIFLLGISAVLAQIGNLFAWPYSPGPFAYIFGLIVALIGAASIFVYLVLIRPGAEEVAEQTPDL